MIKQRVYVQWHPVSSGNIVKISELPVANVFLEDPCCRLLVVVAHIGETYRLLHKPSQKLALPHEYHAEF
jgi:hypothetical protein